MGGAAGTTLSASVTAGAINRTEHSWTISKSVTPDTFTLSGDQTGTATYTVTVDKTTTETQVITGQVCVTNGGGVATEGLSITLDIARNPGGGFVPVVSGVPVDVSPRPVLNPGETFCYEYSVPVSPLFPGETYRVTANVRILNHSGRIGVPFGPSPSTTFTMPERTVIGFNTINVTDTNGESWMFSDDGSQTYQRTFTCSDQGEHTNTATIVETGQQASATVTVDCVTPPPSACTHTIGYWRTHPQETASLLPVTLGNISVNDINQALQILNFFGVPGQVPPEASNGINMLLAQYLSAQLSIKQGADPTAVSSTIAAVNAFLQAEVPSNWINLTRAEREAVWNSLTDAERQQVNEWAATFAAYNNGVIGPGHCPGNPFDDEFEKECCPINININNSSNFRIIINNNRNN
jgi:hypothetical protein